MGVLIRALSILLFITGYLSAFSQVIDASICDSTNRFPITKYSYFLRTTEPITIDSALKSSAPFIKSPNEPVLVYEYDPYYYWFRIIVKNQQDRSRQLMLLMAPVGMYEGQLFQKIGWQWEPVAHAGLKYKFEDRSYQFTHHVFPFTLPARSSDTLYVSIDASNVYKSFGFALINPKDLKIFENKIYFVFGIIVGLLLLFFILNVASFFALKEKLHLWYALYIALLFLIVMKNDHLDQQFLGLDSEKAFRITPYLAIGAFAIAVLLHVVQSFFKAILLQNKLLYRLSTILKVNVLCAALVHSFVFTTVYDYRIQSIAFSWAKISVLLCICIIIANCLYCIKKGFKSAWFIF
ncbi:MAG: 7TMR-DISM family protein, partial [Flavitalea sp.]